MTWKVSLPCTRAEGRALQGEVEAFLALEQAPVLVTSEEAAEQWRLDAFFEEKPDRAALARLRGLVPSAAGAKLRAEPVPE